MASTPTAPNVRSSLDAVRLAAAAASGGDSSSLIHLTFEKIVRAIELKGDLLDFGAGKGLLTTRLLQMGRFDSITATDLMQRPKHLPASVRWIAADLNVTLDLPESVFDTIIAAEVIEHLENPRALVREWFRLLRPQGTLVLSTPNNESWRSLSSLLFQGQYALFGPASYPAHITPLLRDDIARCLLEAGFSKPYFIFTNEGRLPKLGRLSWQTISAGLLKGLRYSDNLLAVASRPGFQDRPPQRLE